VVWGGALSLPRIFSIFKVEIVHFYAFIRTEIQRLVTFDKHIYSAYLLLLERRGINGVYILRANYCMSTQRT